MDCFDCCCSGREDNYLETIISCRNVTYSYPLADNPALNNISVEVEKGKLYGVIGGNGAGKTTLCAVLRGFAPSFFKGEISGDVIFKGKPVSEYGPELSSMIGYVFQNPFNQISGIKDTVFEEVAYGLENFGVPVEEIEKRVIDVMKMADIEELADKSPYALSGGQMQRVALASVIVLEPELLIIDEPTSQLDPEGTESVFRIIEKMKEKGITIILVEHKIDLIAEFADKVIAMEDGKIVSQGEARDVLTDLSLMEHGVALPQVTLLAEELRKRGLDIDRLPSTEKEAVEIISLGLKRRENNGRR